MTEPSRLACLSDNLGIKLSHQHSLLLWEGEVPKLHYNSQSEYSFEQHTTWKSHLSKHFTVPFMQGKHKSIAQSRNLSMTYSHISLSPPEVEVLAWALGKRLQWHWRLSSSRWGWMWEFQLSAALAYLFGMEDTPWKINMEPTNQPFRKGKWSSKPPSLCSILIFQCVWGRKLYSSFLLYSKKDLGPCVSKSHFLLFLESMQ